MSFHGIIVASHFVHRQTSVRLQPSLQVAVSFVVTRFAIRDLLNKENLYKSATQVKPGIVILPGPKKTFISSFRLVAKRSTCNG